MIVVKPKFNTLFSISVFLIAAFGLFAYSLIQMMDGTGSTLWLILVYSSGPIGFVVMVKVLLGWKVIKIGKDKFEIFFPFKFSRKTFNGKQIVGWQKNSIKTFGGKYEELICQFDSGDSLTLSRQEHTEFDKTLKYLNKKYKKLKK